MNIVESGQINLTDSYIDNLIYTRENYISDKILKDAKRVLLDYIGVTVIGAEIVSRMDKINTAIFFESKDKRSGVLGFKEKTDLHNAILLNGICSHISELDDGHRFGMIHLGAPVISALIPVAEKYKLSIYNLLIGIIMGYEAAAILAMQIQPYHRNKGYHTTATCGTIGAALGIAFALNASREQIKSTLSAAVTCSSGLLEIQEDSSSLKPFNAARAALNGYISSQVGSAGFEGPSDILGGSRGFLNVLSNGTTGVSFSKTSQSPELEIERVYIKPFASCRHSHAPIEGTLNIICEHNLQCNNIAQIKISTYNAAVIGHAHSKIQGVGSAKMSIPYAVAVSAISRRASVEQFSEKYISDRSVQNLTGKVVVVSDPKLTELAPFKRTAIVEIKTIEGMIYKKFIEYPLGEPENPMSDKMIEEKVFDLLISLDIPKEKIHNLIKATWEMDTNFYDLINNIKY